jgi:DNA/RNA-binding domain of Phe-tRNA-synthetase-like protein
MSALLPLQLAPELASIVRPIAFESHGLVIVDRAASMDGPLTEACARMRTVPEPLETIAAVRSMYKRVGIDPTKTRPSSEALLRRIRKGDPLPRINSLVDVVNWTSLETQLPFGVYDASRIDGIVTLRLGLPSESYPGIRKDAVNVEGRLTLADAAGAFGNPTSDSTRTMVTTALTRALTVIFVPVSVSEAVAERAAALTRERIAMFCSE